MFLINGIAVPIIECKNATKEAAANGGAGPNRC